MKTLTVDRSSWHCRLARLGGLKFWRPLNLCRYSWHMGIGLWVIAAGAAGLAIVWYAVVDSALAAWFRLEPGIPGGMLAIVGTLFICAWAITRIGIFLHNLICKIPPLPSKASSTVQLAVTWVQSVAGRYCVPIEVIDRDRHE